MVEEHTVIEQRRGPMTEGLLRVLAGLYIVGGIVHLLWFLSLFFYVGIQIPTLAGWPARFWMLLYVGFPFLNVVVCISIAYAFFTYKRWGRYVAIIYNGLWIAAFSVESIGAGMSVGITPFRELTKASLVVFLALVIVVGGIIVLCLRKDVKELMVN